MSDDWASSDWSWGGDWNAPSNDNGSQPAAPAAPAWSAVEEAPARRDYFDLEDGVGHGAANRRSDVAKVETTLSHAGYYGLDGLGGPTGYYGLDGLGGPTGYFGNELGESIKDFQADRGFEVDGYLAPGGETISGLRDDVGEAFADHFAPTAGEIDAHHDALATGQSGLHSTGLLAQLQPRARSSPMESRIPWET